MVLVTSCCLCGTCLSITLCHLLHLWSCGYAIFLATVFFYVKTPYAHVTHALFTKFVWLLSSARHENSSHLSIAADLFSKPSTASSVLIGKGSLWCLSFVVVCVLRVSQSPFAVFCTCGRVDFLFFSYSIFYVQRPSVIHWLHKKTDLQGGTINNPPQFPQVYCSHPASTSGVHLRGRLFKVCCQFCGLLTWQLWFVTVVLLIKQ